MPTLVHAMSIDIQMFLHDPVVDTKHSQKYVWNKNYTSNRGVDIILHATVEEPKAGSTKGKQYHTSGIVIFTGKVHTLLA
jgi:hypothetical protein